MNEKIDTTISGLYSPGSIWINDKTKQLRYRIAHDEPSNWLVPLSVYEVGDNADISEGPNAAFIKRGQPVSIGLLDDLAGDVKDSADPAIIPTNPKKYQWSIGIALEAGNASRTRTDGYKILDHVHVLSHGQIEYDLTDQRENLFFPPLKDKTATGNARRFLWTYDDIGKPVYVTNHPDDCPIGCTNGLTVDITHAYYNGSNIVSIGRLADAPTKDLITDQQIVIEVALAGDVRGMVDSTQFDVQMKNYHGTAPIFENQPTDRLFFVKVKEEEIGGINVPVGEVILTDDDLLIGIEHSPIGAFLAKPKNMGSESVPNYVIDLNDYVSTDLQTKNVLCHRLGILEGEIQQPGYGGFQFPPVDFGKELYLNKGDITTIGSAETYEYKVGIILNDNRVLIDCRYPRTLKKFEALGTIKPAYNDRESSGTKFVADPGFIIIDPTQVHKVTEAWAGLTPDYPYSSINFENLMKATYMNGMYMYSLTENGTFVDLLDYLANTPPIPPFTVDTRYDFGRIRNGYFMFKDTYYSVTELGGTSPAKVISQIKYTTEGSPDAMQYLWPEMVFQHEWTNNPTISLFTNPNPSFDITPLVDLGYYVAGNAQLIENYDITLKLEVPPDDPINPNARTQHIIIPPGFFRNDAGEYYGYQWVIYPSVNNRWLLGMFTRPDGSIPSLRCLGITWPIGTKYTTTGRNLKLFITVRRRPIQYHDLLLNQLGRSDLWQPHATANGDLVTKDAIHFADIIPIAGIDERNEKLYAVGSGATEIRVVSPGPLSGEGYPEDVYWKKMYENYGEHFDIHNQAHQISFLEKYIAPSNLHTGGNLSGISWTYDFKANTVGLSADMALNFRAKNTAKMLVSGTYEKHYISGLLDYNEGRTIYNPSGLYTTPRSALKTLHEIPVGFFNYTDINYQNNEYTLGTAQEQWETRIDGSVPLLERFLNNDVRREIFASVSGNYVSGTSYIYATNNESNTYRQAEWNHIIQEINSIFSTIYKTNDTNAYVIQGGNYQTYQNNLSLLNYAARETQDRLLRLERSVFGADAPTLPAGTIGKTNKAFELYQNCLDEGGLLRVSDQLFKNDIIIKNSDINKPYSSYFKSLYYEIFGRYEDSGTYKIDADNGKDTGNYIYDTTSEYPGKFHNVYFYVNELRNYSDYIWNATSSSISDINRTDQKGYLSAAVIFLEKTVKESGTNRIFLWPRGAENANLSPLTTNAYINNNRWWNTTFMGTRREGTPIVYTQSLEGLLSDVIYKLTFLKENCDDLNMSLSSYFTYLNKSYLVKNINGLFSSVKESPVFPNSKLFIDEIYYKGPMPARENLIHFNGSIDGTTSINGQYSAFGFMDDKISSAGALFISPIYNPKNWTNPEENQKAKLWQTISNRNLYDIIDRWVLSGIIQVDPNNYISGINNQYIQGEIEAPDSFISYHNYSFGRYSLDDFARSVDQLSGWANPDINTYMHSNLFNNVNFLYEKPTDADQESLPFNYLKDTIDIELDLGRIIIPRTNSGDTLINNGLTRYIENIIESWIPYFNSDDLDLQSTTDFKDITVKSPIEISVPQRRAYQSGTLSFPAAQYTEKVIKGIQHNSTPSTTEVDIQVRLNTSISNTISLNASTGIVSVSTNTLQYRVNSSGSWVNVAPAFTMPFEVFNENELVFEPRTIGTSPNQIDLEKFSIGSFTIPNALIIPAETIIIKDDFKILEISGDLDVTTEAVGGRISGNLELDPSMNSNWVPSTTLFNATHNLAIATKGIRQTWSNNFDDDAQVRVSSSVLTNGASGIAPQMVGFRPTIQDFRIHGGHIPLKYDMFVKVKAQEHIVNQIHLNSKIEPINYPKEEFPANYNRTLYPSSNYMAINNGSEVFIWWDAIKNVQGYTLIFLKYDTDTDNDMDPPEVYLKDEPTTLTIKKTPLNCFHFSRLGIYFPGEFYVYVRGLVADDIGALENEMIENYVSKNSTDSERYHKAYLQLSHLITYFHIPGHPSTAIEGRPILNNISSQVLKDICEPKMFDLVSKVYNILN